MMAKANPDLELNFNLVGKKSPEYILAKAAEAEGLCTCSEGSGMGGGVTLTASFKDAESLHRFNTALREIYLELRGSGDLGSSLESGSDGGRQTATSGLGQFLASDAAYRGYETR